MWLVAMSAFLLGREQLCGDTASGIVGTPFDEQKLDF